MNRQDFREKTNHLLENGKQRVGDLYEGAQSTLASAEQNIKDYSHKIYRNMPENTNSIVLGIIGVGCLATAFFLRKRANNKNSYFSNEEN